MIIPVCVLPEPYEVTFKRESSEPIASDMLKRQVNDLNLDQFAFVIELGGEPSVWMLPR